MIITSFKLIKFKSDNSRHKIQNNNFFLVIFIILSNQLNLRLRLVRVKVFPENRYFPEMLFSGKENVFMCLVAFQKNFRKIFSDVWLYS